MKHIFMKIFVVVALFMVFLNTNVKAQEVESTDQLQTIETQDTKAQEVEVPDTLGTKSTILITVGMIDIAIGVGILVYVKQKEA